MLAKLDYRVGTIPPFVKTKRRDLKFVGISMGALIFGKYLHHTTLISNKICSKPTSNIMAI